MPAASRSSSSPRSRFARERREGLNLTDRDGEILSDLYLHRAMRRDQVEARHFGSTPRANARLRLLFDHGYVRRDFPEEAPFGGQAVYAITPKSVPVVAARLGLEEAGVRELTRKAPTPAFLAHALAVVDFALGLGRDAERGGPELVAWIPELSCRHEYDIRPPGGAFRREVFRPDGAFRLRTGGVPRDFFLEMDLGHTSRRQFLDKVAGFETFHRSGLYGGLYGGQAPVLAVVTTGMLRLRHLAAVAARIPGADVRLSVRADVEEAGAAGAPWWTPAGTRTGLMAPGARGPPDTKAA